MRIYGEISYLVVISEGAGQVDLNKPVKMVIIIMLPRQIAVMMSSSHLEYDIIALRRNYQLS